MERKLKWSHEGDYSTPKKMVFERLAPEVSCLSCGLVKSKTHMRMIRNVVLRVTYASLVKECFLVDLPSESSHRLCDICIKRMQETVMWRREAVMRLQKLASLKRSPEKSTPVKSSESGPTDESVELSAEIPASPLLPSLPMVSNCVTNAQQQLPEPLAMHRYAKKPKRTPLPNVPAEVAEISFERHTYARKTVFEQAAAARKSLSFSNQTTKSSRDRGSNMILDLKERLESCSDTSDVASVVLSITTLRDEIEARFLQTMNSCILTLLGDNPETKSLLGMSLTDERLNYVLEAAVTEMNKRVPFLFRVLTVAAGVNSGTKKELFLGLVYGMIMRQRSQRLNIIQKLMTATCLRYHASNELINMLHTVNLSLAEGSKLYFLSNLAQSANCELLQLIKSGRNCKVTVDNIDGRMIANQVRLKSGNRDYHHTHWTVLPDRFDEDEIDAILQNPRVAIQGPYDRPPPELYYCSATENESLRYAYGLVIAEILCEEIERLSCLAKSVPTSFPHRWRDITARKSPVYSQPIILEDSKSLPSCVRILQKISDDLQAIFRGAGREEDFVSGCMNVTVGGDQLTRSHLDSAKILRAGAHTVLETFTNLGPIVEECFHIQQDLLEKIYKKYYNSSMGRVPGTLSHLKAQLERTNVNGDVKAGGAFEAHKDFAVLVAKMMVVNVFNERVGEQYEMPQHIRLWSNAKKLAWLMDLIKPVLHDLYVDIQAPQRYATHIPGPSPPTRSDDELFNYSTSYIRTMMDFMVFSKVIAAGDVDRLGPILKRFIPTFVGLTSFRSKYAIEAINFLTKTEWVLGEKQSIAVKLRAFVNLQGKEGRNKPADMQQEINIKKVKNIIKGLGAGKTDQAMVRSSQAAPAIDGLVENFRMSLGLGPASKAFDHHTKDESRDREVVKNVLGQARPFQVSAGRKIGLNVNASIFDDLNKEKLNDFIKRHSDRATNYCTAAPAEPAEPADHADEFCAFGVDEDEDADEDDN